MLVIAVYVPEDHVNVVIDAMATAGAGEIGDYRRCAFTIKGEGTFQPKAGATPFIGTVGEVEVVSERKIEMVCLRDKAKLAIQAMIQAHPYETPAYHILEAKTLEDLI
ncbi:NGG1p interacting factor NIF3 [Vibrio sp. RC27]